MPSIYFFQNIFSLLSLTQANSGPKVAIIKFPLLVKLRSPENINLKVKLSLPDISTKKMTKFCQTYNIKACQWKSPIDCRICFSSFVKIKDKPKQQKSVLHLNVSSKLTLLHQSSCVAVGVYCALSFVSLLVVFRFIKRCSLNVLYYFLLNVSSLFSICPCCLGVFMLES